jgi:RNA polymerase sigma factor (sigma-70 family)
MKAVWVSDTTAIARSDDAESPHSEADFLHGLRQGRSSSFELLYTLYRPQIYNLALRTLHDAQEAEDATQETFLKAFQQIPRQEKGFQLEPWLYRVAVNTCFDHLRARRRRPTTPLAAESEPASPTDGFAQAETGRLVEETLKRLSERHRVALILKDLHGFSHDEIATVLGISRGAAETLLFRAREAFRSTFEEISRSPSPRDEGCVYARSVALAVVGRDLSPAQRRELDAHVKGCPACRRSLQLQGGLAVGLGLFVRQLAPPWLGGPPLTPTAAAAGALTPASAAGSAAAATFGGASSTGILAKIVVLIGGKTAVAAAVAAGVTLVGGTAAYTQLERGHAQPARTTPEVSAAANATPIRGSTRVEAPETNTTSSHGPHGRSLATHGKAKGKTAKPQAPHNIKGKKVASGHTRKTTIGRPSDGRSSRQKTGIAERNTKALHDSGSPRKDGSGADRKDTSGSKTSAP